MPKYNGYVDMKHRGYGYSYPCSPWFSNLTYKKYFQTFPNNIFKTYSYQEYPHMNKRIFNLFDMFEIAKKDISNKGGFFWQFFRNPCSLFQNVTMDKK